MGSEKKMYTRKEWKVVIDMERKKGVSVVTDRSSGKKRSKPSRSKDVHGD